MTDGPSSWPPLDLTAPPAQRAQIVDQRLRTLKAKLDTLPQLDKEERELVDWLIDFARGWRLFWKLGAWGVAVLAALAGAVQAWDAVARVFGRGA